MGIILRLIFTFRKVIKVSFHPFLTPLDFKIILHRQMALVMTLFTSIN